MSPSGKDDKKSGYPGPKGPRCRSGIEGLDKILNGGIPVGNSVLLTGACGTGKTTLSVEFLNFGAQHASVADEPDHVFLKSSKNGSPSTSWRVSSTGSFLFHPA